MKKFLAILTIVAMLSGMVVIGASADGTYAIDMDFTDYAGSTAGKHQNQNLNTVENGIARIEHGLGVYPIGNGAVSGDSALIGVDGAMQTKGFWIKVPEFFAGKSAGTYTVEFDYSSTADIHGYRLDVGSTLNQRIEAGSGWGGSAVFVTDKEGYNSNSIAVFGAPSSSGHASLTFDWDGTLTAPTADGVGNLIVADYDIEALCIKVVASNSSVFTIDNLKVGNIVEPAEVALESIKTPLTGPGIAYPNNFDTYEKVGASTELAHKNANATVGSDAITHIDKAEGVYAFGYGKLAETQYLNQVAGKSGADGDYAVSANRIWIKIPEFFKDKSAGTYSVSFDYKKDANTDGLYAVRIDVGATINGGNTGFHVVSSAEGFNTGYNTNNYTTSKYPDKYNCARQLVAATNTNTNWQSLSFDFAWDGTITEFNNPAKESDYDKYGFCFMLAANGAFQIDNLVVTGVDNRTGTIVDYANKDMTVTNRLYNLDKKAATSGVVINAAYDQNGNLRAVNTADIAVDADQDYAEAVVTLPIPAGVTKNWQFKGFVWSDLDNEIEPLTESSDILEGRIFNGSFEIMPKTGIITSGVEHNAARNWNATTSDGTSPVIESEGGAVDGNYLVGLVSGYGVKANISDLLAKYGAGTYKFKVYAKIPGNHTLVNGMYIYEDVRKSPKSGFAYPGISYQDNNDVITTDLGTFYAYNFEYTVTEDDMAGWNENSCISMGHYYKDVVPTTIYFDALTFTGFTPAQ